MSQEGPWWAYLNACFRQFPPAQKQQVSPTLGVKPVTVQRWRNGTSSPHAAHVCSLLELLPDDQREHLRLLIAQRPEGTRVAAAAGVCGRKGVPPLLLFCAKAGWLVRSLFPATRPLS